MRVWKVFPPPAVTAGHEDTGGDERAKEKGWRAEVVGEWGKGEVTVGKVEVRCEAVS